MTNPEELIDWLSWEATKVVKRTDNPSLMVEIRTLHLRDRSIEALQELFGVFTHRTISRVGDHKLAQDIQAVKKKYGAKPR